VKYLRRPSSSSSSKEKKEKPFPLFSGPPSFLLKKEEKGKNVAFLPFFPFKKKLREKKKKMSLPFSVSLL